MVWYDIIMIIRGKPERAPSTRETRNGKSDHGHSLAASALVILCIWLYFCDMVKLDLAIALQ